ncbi:hypothetical protein B5X24_HaOG217097 [Helicoverpa armigera]|uniref:Uncharacterized protein n=1 Tax=Helicoverpa armigera TaxID=29058 RepID=A0A2W1C409_HELAM|nr:hypothetical protein B5X24_HaOG217097 [Helicoverpa armigera]
MLCAKRDWDKTISYITVNELILTKLDNLVHNHPMETLSEDAKDMINSIKLSYHAHEKTLSLITERIEIEKVKYQISLISDTEKAQREMQKQQEMQNVLSEIE